MGYDNPSHFTSEALPRLVPVEVRLGRTSREKLLYRDSKLQFECFRFFRHFKAVTVITDKRLSMIMIG